MFIYNPKQLEKPSPITWVTKFLHNIEYEDVIISGVLVACLEKRPYYCDRGHWYVKCFLSDIDSDDKFPRYYMSKHVAKTETEAFLKWRLWKQHENK